jgi:hypothetical protein
MDELKVEIEENSVIPKDHPERKKIQNFTRWLQSSGADSKKLKIRFLSEDNRCVYSSKDISQGEQVLFIPHQSLISVDMAQKTPLGRKLTE